MKYKEWLKVWLDNYVKPITKYRTYIQYSDIINLHINEFLGDYDLIELTNIILQRHITYLSKCGNKNTNNGLSVSYINSIINVIKSSLIVAKSLGLISENQSIMIKRPKYNGKQVQCFSLLEQKKIEDYVLNSKKDKLIGVIISLYTGIRIGELLSLEWTDIDYRKRILTINKTCYDGKDLNGNYCRFIDTPKTYSSNREIPIPSKIFELIKSLKKKSHSIYIISNDSKLISIRSYQKSFELMLKKLKINHKGFHSLRHTFATRAIECGIDVKTLSEILGHKNASVTINRYVHSMDEHKKNMMEKLNKIF